MKMNSNSQKGGTGDNLEKLVFDVLMENGYVMPETEDEVRLAEERVSKTNNPIPKTLQDPGVILARIKGQDRAATDKIVSLPKNQFAETVSELARAARKGTEIPSSIEDKMRRNRAKADAEIDPKSKPD